MPFSNNIIYYEPFVISCLVSIRVRLYAKYTDIVLREFVNDRSVAEKPTVSLVVIFTFSAKNLSFRHYLMSATL